jgi:hypothetical protein
MTLKRRRGYHDESENDDEEDIPDPARMKVNDHTIEK